MPEFACAQGIGQFEFGLGHTWTPSKGKELSDHRPTVSKNRSMPSLTLGCQSSLIDEEW